MKRRAFLASLTGAAATLPLAVHAQQAGKRPTIGFLGLTSPAGYAKQIEALRQGLRDLGYVEGSNVTIEYRWADGNYARLPELMAQLLHSDVIVTHGTPGAMAAKRATTTIPIVMALVGDPVSTGIVASFARPGGNITGQSFFNPELRAKRIDLLKEVKPRIAHVAVLMNVESAAIGPEMRMIEQTAQTLNVRAQQFLVRAASEFETAFEKMQHAGAEAVEIGDDALTNSNGAILATLAVRRRLLSIGPSEFAPAGGLIGFGVDFAAAYRRAAVFIDKVLKGTKPADLPIEQATKFEFAINLQVAKALGVEVPAATLLRADEVIE